MPVTEEKILDGDPGGLSGIVGYLKSFLGLDRLMAAAAPLAALGDAAGELVDDLDFVFSNDVVAVAKVKAVDHQSPLDDLVPADHSKRSQFVAVAQST